ncbi:MAG: mechanosensitive ion channel family protein [Rhodobacteraceae bacterium]|nr:mechanosensitive ion channel family protein [Paracoccaceae bacterium]
MTGHGGLRALRSALLLVVFLALGVSPGSVMAQQAGGGTASPSATPEPQPQPGVAVAPRPAAPAGTAVVVSKGAGKASGPDYGAWELLAERAENLLSNPETETRGLELLRNQLVTERAKFLAAQNTNAARIATVREQIAALGPAPPQGETEAQEVALRRQQLADQLVQLQAPGLTAEEAFRRADGLIGEVDRTLRERQASQLLQLWPSPVNPANWPEAVVALGDVTVRLWTETTTRWTRGDGRQALFDNLPLILLLAVLGLGLITQTRRVAMMSQARLPRPRTARGRRVVALLLSMVQVVLPVLGAIALARAVEATGLVGPVGTALAEVLPAVVFALVASNWLGHAVFPLEEGDEVSTLLVAERRAEGRFLARSIGLVLAVEAVRHLLVVEVGGSDTANAVLAFPVLATTAVLIFRMGQLLRRHVRSVQQGEEGLSYGLRVLGLLARAVMLTSVAGVALGAVGYLAAATALVYPSVLSLGLVAVLFVLQRLVADLYGLVTRSDAADQEGLVPVLIGFAMSVASLPLFAVIWGARWAEITELWQRFLQGFQIGATRVSPTDFLVFAIIFGAGYAVTRLLQGALKGTILPRTSLDQGGQNAVVSGTGYLGVFLAALIAINSAGIDLSGLAIVAGALSVGIGFGLQNIVSNFVSGIILLIERPVSEGDWIEVGNVQGTVKTISVRSTRIQTFDRSDVIVPNADLVTQRVTNWTRFNLTGRLVVPVAVVPGCDTRQVERVLREIAEAQPLAILNPPPVIAFMGFGADCLNFEMRIILRDVNFSLQVRSEINHMIVQRFADAGIDMPGARKAEAVADAAAFFAAEIATDPAPAAKPAQQTGPTSARATPGKKRSPETRDPTERQDSP